MNGDGRDDAALVAAVLAGDSAAFGAIYDRYADRIHDYASSLLRNSSDAADVMQDTFLAASQRLDQLRDPSRLRPWLYAIARSFVFAITRNRQRVEVSEDIDQAVEMTGHEGSLDAVDLVWTAAAGLEVGDRDVLDLHLRQGLDGRDLAAALGVPSNTANVMLHRVRERLEQSVGAVLLARSSHGECAEFDVLVADGLSPLVRKRVARHVESCATCSERRARSTSATALFSMSAGVAAPLALRNVVLERIGTEAAVESAGRLEWNADGFPKPPLSGLRASGQPERHAPRASGRPRWMTIVASAACLVIGLAALFVVLRRGADEELVSSAAVSSTAPADSSSFSSLSAVDVAVPATIAERAPASIATAPIATPPTAPPAAPTSAPASPVSTNSAPDTPTSSTSSSVVLTDPLAITVVDYQCASTMVVVVDVTGVPPLSANLRFVEGGDTIPFVVDPLRSGRFSVSVATGEGSATPQIFARSGDGATRADSITKQLERCVVID